VRPAGKRRKKKEEEKEKKMAKYLSESSEWYFGAVNKHHRFRF